MELILASGSPARARILQEAGFNFQIYQTNVEEEPPNASNPKNYVTRLAAQKAVAALEKFPRSLILAADTMALNEKGELLGKPVSEQQAAEYLLARSGAAEEIITGFCLAYDRQMVTDAVSSRIVFKKIPINIQKKILSGGEWQGVCGGLRIEGSIGPYVESVSGDQDNIMGLPLTKIAPLIKQISAETSRNAPISS